jgi:hypothetical protein
MTNEKTFGPKEGQDQDSSKSGTTPSDAAGSTTMGAQDQSGPKQAAKPMPSPKRRGRPMPHTDYETGYGRPPRNAQFKPGTSGNPNGRPQGAKGRVTNALPDSVSRAIREEMQRTIKVTDVQGERELPTMNAIIRSLKVKALKGNVRAAETLIKVATAVEKADLRISESHLEWMIKYKTFWEECLKSAKAKANPEKYDPLPHPDDIEIDFATGAVLIKGPMSKEERDKVLEVFEHRQFLQAGVKELDEFIAKCRPSKMRDGFIEIRQLAMDKIRALDDAMPYPWTAAGLRKWTGG